MQPSANMTSPEATLAHPTNSLSHSCPYRGGPQTANPMVHWPRALPAPFMKEDTMLELSVMIGIENGLDWPRWKQLVQTIEAAGYAGLYLSDHFAWHGTAGHALELIVGLTYLADHTERVRFGSLVSPFTIREPVMLLRQAIALDELSNGRMILGFGAGNRDDEHSMFGYDFSDVASRM